MIMPENRKQLSPEEKLLLLSIARDAVSAAAQGDRLPNLDLASLPPALREKGASFVTLTSRGQLRGCIGALEASQPLALDVQEHAEAAATQDFRFPPVTPQEILSIRIELSRLTTPVQLEYKDSKQLAEMLKPGHDGVVIRDGIRRATFLPQVWEKLPSPEDFLSQLCLKMGASPDQWRKKRMSVYTYQVEEFEEE
jgi:AmmeMemoRadiSam system protein A